MIHLLIRAWTVNPLAVQMNQHMLPSPCSHEAETLHSQNQPSEEAGLRVSNCSHKIKKTTHKQEFTYLKGYKPLLSWTGCCGCEHIPVRQLAPPKNMAPVTQERNTELEEQSRLWKGFFVNYVPTCFQHKHLMPQEIKEGRDKKARFSQGFPTWTGSQCSPTSFSYPHMLLMLTSRDVQKELAHCCPACQGAASKLPKKCLDCSKGRRWIYEKCTISPELHQVNNMFLPPCTSVNHHVTVELNNVTLM